MEIMQSCQLSKDQVLRMIDKRQVKVGGSVIIQKNSIYHGDINFVIFEPKELNNIEPLYITDDFVVYDKPSGLLVHPNKHDDSPSLLDAIRYKFGSDANIVHRIDRETSGIVIASLCKKCEHELKKLFHDHKVIKEYKAFVRGKVDKNLDIDAPISLDQEGLIRLKGSIKPDGLASFTSVYPIKYYPEWDISYVAIFPKTGRQHQIRLHMFHVKHPLLGEPLYGNDESFSDEFLKKEVSSEERKVVTGASRVLLHAHKISFTYQEKEYSAETNDPESSLLRELSRD
jgi:23S rRNA pseudouridine1911/1915/1917 synthase